jgi:hypothetical protein
MRNKKVIWPAFLMLFILFLACKNDNNTPLATQIQNGLGSKGGTIATTDGSLSVIVPTNALAKDTVIKIQTSTEIAPNGIGFVQKLSPDGIKFQKPLTLVFKYNESELTQRKTYPELLRIATRETGKNWEVLQNVKLDKANKTISVEATHFSDWSVIAVKGSIAYETVAVDVSATRTTYSQENIVLFEKIDTLIGRKNDVDTSRTFVYGSYHRTIIKTQSEDPGSVFIYLNSKDELKVSPYDATPVSFTNADGFVMIVSGLAIVVRKSIFGPVEYFSGYGYPPTQITITNWGKNAGDLIAGNFSGRLYYGGKTQEDISGTFAFIRN